jgi:hypothetical protein
MEGYKIPAIGYPYKALFAGFKMESGKMKGPSN